MSSQSSLSSASDHEDEDEVAYDDYPSDLEQQSAFEKPRKLKLKLNVPRTDTTPVQAGRKRARQEEDPAGQGNETPSTSNVGRKLKLNVRPQLATPASLIENPTLKKPTIKLKLSSSTPTSTPTPTPASISTPIPRKTHISKVKLKAPTLASPFPTPGSSTGASPAASSSTPTPKPQNDGDGYETPSKKVRVINPFPPRKEKAAHPLAEEVVPTSATQEDDVMMTEHGIVKDDLEDVKLQLTDGGDIEPFPEAPQPPSAIPRYLQSETKPFSPEPSSVKLESDDSPSPNPIDSSVPSPHDSTPSGTSTPQTDWTGAYAQRGGRGRPYLRVKRPFREVLKRILTDLKRKDQYGLFLDPVSEEDYPGYWQAIGGQDNAMDLGTMERKVDDREYKTLEDFEADITRMVVACRTFNGPDTFPTREAEIVQALSQKLIERHRHVVRSPSPSPVRGSTVAPTPGVMTPDLRSVSPSVMQQARPTIPPKSLIPEAMLEYPMNSDAARAVGYFATGGKRPRTKKEIRSREKWDGQWREWYVEGDRNLGEADDAAELLGVGFRTEKVEKPSVIDWDDPVMRAEEVWQPTPVLLGQAEEEPPAIPTRKVSHLDWGINQELRRTDPRREIAGARRNPAWQAVRTVTMGNDLANEAYLRSIDAFVRGAEVAVHAVEGDEVDKPDIEIDDRPTLSEYVRTTWRGGFINDDLRGLVAEAGRAIAAPSEDSDMHDMVTDARKRLPVLNELRSYSARGPGVDLACLLRTSSDFSVGTGPGPGAGAARAAWFQSSLSKAGQQIVDASKRREAKVEVDTEEGERMTKLRLDLLALVKNVPVHELRPMTSAEAEKLPPAVRGLVKVLPAGKS